MTVLAAPDRPAGARRPARLGRLAAARHLPPAVLAVLTLAAVAEAMLRAGQHPATVPSLAVNMIAGTLLAVATTVPPGFLDPTPAAVAVTVAAVLAVVGFHCLTAAGAASTALALLRLGRGTPRAPRLAAALCPPLLVLAVVAATVPDFSLPYERTLIILLAAAGPTAAAAGAAARAQAEAQAHRAAREAVARSLLEHTARGERARIARELHDVVAHHISLIAVRAETARLTTPDLPASGAQRLLEIGDTARAGLTEMRRLLGVLRADAAVPADDSSHLHPQPGLSQLNDLLDSARAASGSTTRLILSGRSHPLSPGVELAAYRITQEALTNARRHAPGAAVDVELRYTPTALHLTIRDNGPGPSGGPPVADGVPISSSAHLPPPKTSPLVLSPSGHGLSGMHERALAAGGHLHTGPAPGGGFLVRATLPTASGDAA